MQRPCELLPIRAPLGRFEPNEGGDAGAELVFLSRRTSTVPPARANQPNTGQAATSCLATNTAGDSAARTRISR
jgi:hypothetical protein